MHGSQRQHVDGHRCSGHVDGCTQRQRNGIGIAVQPQALGQLHVHRDVGRGTAREECRHATLAQTGEHQREGITARHEPDDQRIHHQRHDQHAADQQAQQLHILLQHIPAGSQDGVDHQAHHAKRCKADHQPHHPGNRIRHIAQQLARGAIRMTQTQTDHHCPGQHPDVVGMHQRLDRVVDHAQHQVFQHLQHVTGRRQCFSHRLQGELHREQETAAGCHQRRSKGADRIQDQDRAHMGLHALLVVGNGRHHQHEHQQRCHRLERPHEQGTKQDGGACRLRPQHSQRNADHQSHENLHHQRTMPDEMPDRIHHQKPLMNDPASPNATPCMPSNPHRMAG